MVVSPLFYSTQQALLRFHSLELLLLLQEIDFLSEKRRVFKRASLFQARFVTINYHGKGGRGRFLSDSP